MLTTSSRPPIPVFQRVCEIQSRGLQSRYEAEQQSRKDRSSQREEQNAEVHVGFSQTRNTPGQLPCDESRSPISEKHAESSANQCKEQTAGQQLTNNSPPACTQRNANRDLSFARRPSNKK